MTAVLFDAFCVALQGDGWPVTRRGTGPHVVETSFAGTQHTWRCEGRVFEEQGQIVFDSILPEVLDADRQADACAVLARVNWEIITGAFIMDADGREMRFRTALLTPLSMALYPDLALAMVYANVLTVDRCLADLVSMLHDAGAVGADNGIWQADDSLVVSPGAPRQAPPPS
jgi:hypothetical protein